MGAAGLHQLCRMLPARSSSVIIVITLKVYPIQTLLHCYDAVSTACLLTDCLITFASALQGFTLLHHAVIGNHADAAAALLSQGADVNAKLKSARVRHADTQYCFGLSPCIACHKN